MTTATTEILLDAVAERSGQVRFTVTLAKIAASIFTAIGWIISAVWRAVVFCAFFFRIGFWKGQGLTDDEILARVKPQEK